MRTGRTADQEDHCGGFAALQLGHQPAAPPGPPKARPTCGPRLRGDKEPRDPSRCSPAQTTAICASKTPLSLSVSLTLSCLKDVHGWAGAESLGPFASMGGLGMTPEHWLSDFARFYISAHGSNFCRNSDKGASGPGTSLLQLPVAASAHPGQPHVLTSTTGTSALCGNRAQGQGLPPHSDSWAPPCPARDSATTDKVAAKFRCPVSSGVSNICKCP